MKTEPSEPAATAVFEKSANGRRVAPGVVLEGAWAVAVAAILLAELWSGEQLRVSSTVGLSVLGLFAAGPLAFVRHRPFPAYTVNVIAVIALVTFGGPSEVYQYTNLVALYFVAASRVPAGDEGSSSGTNRQHWLRVEGPSWAALASGLLGVLYYFARFPNEGSQVIILMVVMLWCSAWLLGRVNGFRRVQQELRAERDLSTELAEARRLRLELQTDRAEMARELHDILGHTLNVMLVHAGAGRRALPDDPAGATSALTTIETTGRAAMDDLDRVLGLLRQVDGQEEAVSGRQPLPGLADLPDLITTVDDTSSAAVALSIDSDLDEKVVGRPTQLAVYRIIQEALTNVLKHSGADAVHVKLAITDQTLVLTVADNGRGLDPAKVGAVGPGSGRGLIGMAERARVHGGTLTLSEGPAGGTLVTARLPGGPT